MKARLYFALALATGVTSSAFSLVVASEAVADDLCGEAAWSEASGLTASGEQSRPDALTAAHPSLPFGTRVEVANLKNGSSVVVRINDRGSFKRGRVILVSRAAAEHLGMIHDGTVDVRLTVLNDSGSRSGACGGVSPGRVAVAPPDVDNVVADEARLVDDRVTSDLTGETSGSSDSLPADETTTVNDPFSVHFDIAFRAETWQEVELAKAIAAFAPRLAAPPRPRSVKTPSPLPAPDRLRQIRLSPAFIAFVLSDEVSFPDLARFERVRRPARLSQLMK